MRHRKARPQGGDATLKRENRLILVTGAEIEITAKRPGDRVAITLYERRFDRYDFGCLITWEGDRVPADQIEHVFVTAWPLWLTNLVGADTRGELKPREIKKAMKAALRCGDERLNLIYDLVHEIV